MKIFSLEYWFYLSMLGFGANMIKYGMGAIDFILDGKILLGILLIIVYFLGMGLVARAWVSLGFPISGFSQTFFGKVKKQ